MSIIPIALGLAILKDGIDAWQDLIGKRSQRFGFVKEQKNGINFAVSMILKMLQKMNWMILEN